MKPIDMQNMKEYKLPEDEVHLEALDLIKEGSFVLSAGCGSGREVKELVEKDCLVVAIDKRPEVILESKKEEQIAEYKIEDISKFRRRNTFDYIICLWNTINQLSVEERIKFIKKSKSNLRKGGSLIITTRHRLSSFKLFLMTLISQIQADYYYHPSEIKEWFTEAKMKYNQKSINGHLLIIAKK